MSKLLSKKQLIEVVRKLHKQGKRIITTNGSFDILHAGHVYVLKTAKSLGDYLIVGLNSDSSIRKYKGKDRPIIPQKFRAELLCAIQDVDFVYIFNELNPIEFLKIAQPYIHVNSSEYGKHCIEAPTVKKYGGRLKIVGRKKNLLSTTEIIHRIVKVYGRT
jgi:D-glycero-beta-D-manno-heptose 1-phosphate adenylyltransferase